MPLQRKPVERQFDSLSQQALQDVVGSFGMGALIAAHTLVVEGDRLLLLSDKSETSRKYVVDTDAGRYFLKEVPWYCDDQQHRDFSRFFPLRYFALFHHLLRLY